MTGLRSIITHEYFGVGPRIIWEMAGKRLSEAELRVRSMLDQLGPNWSRPHF